MAPPRSHRRCAKCTGGWKSSRIRPLDGDALLDFGDQAVIAGPPPHVVQHAAGNPRGGFAALACSSSVASIGRRRHCVRLTCSRYDVADLGQDVAHSASSPSLSSSSGGSGIGDLDQPYREVCIALPLIDRLGGHGDARRQGFETLSATDDQRWRRRCTARRHGTLRPRPRPASRAWLRRSPPASPPFRSSRLAHGAHARHRRARPRRCWTAPSFSDGDIGRDTGRGQSRRGRRRRCTTQAFSLPRRPRTWAIGSIHSRDRKAPENCRLTPAGLDSGPSRLLNTVRVPIDRRTRARRRGAWRCGASRRHQEADADLSDRALYVGPCRQSMLTPSAVSTSAAPDFDDSARLPCLATGTPAPATTMAVAVEIL